MRTGLVVVGLILLILGAVLLFIPILPGNTNFSAVSPTQCVSQATCQVSYNIYEASPSLLGGTSAKFTWSSPSTIFFHAVTCTNAVSGSQLSSATTTAQFNAACGTSNVIANTTGTGGTYTFTIPSGGSFVFFGISAGTSSVTGSSTLTATEPLLGLVILVVGLLLLIVGAATTSKKKKAARSAPPQPWGAPGPGGAPPAGSAPGAPPQAWQQPPPQR